MHVIAYFGVWKCYVCSHLCNCILNLVMQCCLFKYICWCSVDRANHIAHGLNKGTRRWWFHQTLTIVYQQSFAHNTHSLLTRIVCVVIGLPTHFLLQTYSSCITHILLSWTISVLLAQCKQFIRVNCMPYIAHTPSSGCPFLLFRLIKNSSSEWTVCCVSHTPSSGCPFLLFLLITTVNWTKSNALHRTRN